MEDKYQNFAKVHQFAFMFTLLFTHEENSSAPEDFTSLACLRRPELGNYFSRTPIRFTSTLMDVLRSIGRCWGTLLVWKPTPTPSHGSTWRDKLFWTWALGQEFWPCWQWRMVRLPRFTQVPRNDFLPMGKYRYFSYIVFKNLYFRPT